MNKPEIDITLERVYPLPFYTIGKITTEDGVIKCNSIEDKVRDLNADGDLLDKGEGKVPGETAVPYGRYEIILVDSPKFKREVPLLLGVKHFTAIEIHAGSTQKNSAGCIIPGKNTIKGRVTNSRYWEDKITAWIRQKRKEGFRTFINIIPKR